jgi:hypothetical protein
MTSHPAMTLLAEGICPDIHLFQKVHHAMFVPKYLAFYLLIIILD